MAALSYSTTINQPVDKVFNYLITVENHKSWTPSLLEAKVTPAGPVGVGSIYAYTTDVMGRKYESQMQVTAFEPNKKWATKVIGIPNSVETVYDFEGSGTATKVTLSMDVPAGAYPAAAEGMIKQQMQKSLEDQANRIKQQLEK